MTGKKIALVHRYFWPQNYPYAIMLKHIVESLVSVDANVTVYTSFSGEKNEKLSRDLWQEKSVVDIQTANLPSERQISVFRKALNAVWFAVWVVIKLLSCRHEVVMVATTPPVIIAFLVTLVSKFKCFKVVYHCQDIHPESLYINGSFKSRLLYKLLVWMDSVTVNNAWRVIVLSEDMKKTFVGRGLSERNIHVINNFIFQTVNSGDAVRQKVSTKNKTRFIFAGSLGRFQNLDVLIEGVSGFKDNKNVEFLFLGDGPLKSKVESYCYKHHLENVEFISQVPIDEALEYMYDSDVGIVSISEGVSKVAFPSKSIMYMSTGLPVLAVIDKDSALSKMIMRNKLGVAVEPTVFGVRNGISLILETIEKDGFACASIKKHAEENYSKTVILRKISSLIMDY